MSKTDEHTAEEMWRELRDGVVREWKNLMDVTPEATSSQVTLHIDYGSLDMRFDPERKSVQVALRPCCEREDCPTPVSKQEIVYEPVINPGGRRGWRRSSYEHGQKGMAHMLVYHLLKYRGPR